MLDALAAFAQLTLYVGVLCATGAVLAQASLPVQGSAAVILFRMARFGAITTVGATLGGAVILLYRLGGQFDNDAISAVLMSSIGAAGGLRISGALLLLTAGTHKDSFSAGMRLSYALLIASSFVFSGHAAAVGMPAGLIAFAHVSLGAWWVGSLVALEHVCGRNDRFAASTLVRRFSSIALSAVAALVVAGSVLVLVLVGAEALTLSAYVISLGIKIALAFAVIGVATFNKYRLTPRLEGDEHALRTLRLTIRIELILITAVVIATAILTTYTSPDG